MHSETLSVDELIRPIDISMSATRTDSNPTMDEARTKGVPEPREQRPDPGGSYPALEGLFRR